MVLFAAPLCAQQPAQRRRSLRRSLKPRRPKLDPTFETLLSTDSYKLYGEVRNIGQLMSNGGGWATSSIHYQAGRSPKEFNSIIKFLKTNAEALTSSRLLFATWPARTGVPDAFVAIEFPTAEDAAKFAPKLETFLPVSSAMPVATPEESPLGEPRRPTHHGRLRRETRGNTSRSGSFANATGRTSGVCAVACG